MLHALALLLLILGSHALAMTGERTPFPYQEVAAWGHDVSEGVMDG
jgi:hypothetical protein